MPVSRFLRFVATGLGVMEFGQILASAGYARNDGPLTVLWPGIAVASVVTLWPYLAHVPATPSVLREDG